MDIVAIFAASLIGLVVVSDIVLAAVSSWRDRRPSAPQEAITWSQLIRESYGITTFFAWAISVWVGRWFSPIEAPLMEWYVGFPIVVALTLVVVLAAFFLWRRYRRPIIPPIVIVSLGLASGWIFIPLCPVL